MTITRPSLPTSGPVSRADLQRLNDLTIALDQTDRDLVRADIVAKLPGGTANPNYFRNGGLEIWTAGITPVNCAVGVKQIRADYWWTRLAATSSAVVTCERAGGPNQTWLYAARITGATGAGIVDYGQDVRPQLGAPLSPKVTVTYTITNGSGASLTPLVRLDTCDVFGDYGATTNRVSTAAPSVASGATVTQSVTLDTSDTTTAAALRNGAIVYLRFPAGALDSAIKSVQLAALKLEAGDIATAHVPEPALDDPAAESVQDREFLFNGDFADFRWLTTSTTCAEDVETYAAAGWWARPSDGSTLVYSRNADAPDTRSRFCALLTGSTETTGTVDFGQDMPGRNSQRLNGLAATFSCYLFNGTGSAVNTAALLLQTCDSLDSFTALTTEATQTLPNLPAGAWTRVSYALNPATRSNGLRLLLRFPAGSLTSGKTIKIAQAQLELGTVVTSFDPPPVFRLAEPPPGCGPDLRITATGLPSQVFITAEGATFREAGGLLPRRPINLTLSGATTGANALDTGTIANNTGYYVYLIANHAGVAGLLSTNPTSPALPAGYRWKELIGWMFYGSSTFVGQIQLGRVGFYTPRLLVTGGTLTGSYVSALTIAGLGSDGLLTFGPQQMRRLRGTVGTTGATPTASVIAAADSSGFGERGYNCVGSNNIVSTIDGASYFNREAFDQMLFPSTTPDFYLKGTSVTNLRIELSGWEF